MKRSGLFILAFASLIMLVIPPALGAMLSPFINRGVIDVAQYGNAHGGRSSTFWKNRVYISGWPNGCVDPLFVVNVSDPDNPTFVTRAGGSECYFNELKVVEDKLYIAGWGNMLKIYDISNPDQVNYLGSWDRPNDTWGYFSWDLDVHDNRVYLTETSEQSGGAYFIDVTNPRSPNPIKWMDNLPQGSMGGIAAKGSYLYFGNNHYGSTPAMNSFWLRIANISDETQPYLVKGYQFPNAVGQMFIRGNLLYVSCGGLRIFDISDPLNPVQIGHWQRDGGMGELHFQGNHVFSPTGGNGLVCINVTDPTNPYIDAQPNFDHYNEYEDIVCGNGRFIYLGSVSDEARIPPDGSKEALLHVLEFFDQDPDDTGPNKWSATSLGEPAWDLQYEADSLPTAASPAWSLYEGAEVWASASGGVLRVNDTGTASGDKIKWSRYWDGTNTRGTTVLVRARCQSYSGATSIPNLTVEDGKYYEEFSLLSDRIKANVSGLQYMLDGTAWHTYRITTKGTSFKVYVDENATPVISGTLTAATNRARVIFGSGSSPARQDIYFDYIHLYSNGEYAPSAPVMDMNPDITVTASDIDGSGSLSGINPATARVEWSTDGGATWTASGGMLWDCRYPADSMPSATTPRWMIAEGSDTWGSIVSGTLRVNDTSTSSGTKIKWARRWKATPSTGATVITRARCASAGGDTSLLGNIYVDDGVHYERLKILPTRIELGETHLTYNLDGTAWHTYRVTISGDTIQVYVDDAATPAITGTLTAATEGNGARIMFGSGASAATQDIYFDYVSYTQEGVLPPGQGDADGPVVVTCTAPFGNDRGSVTAFGVPFNQYSSSLNKIRFIIKDVEGNTGRSPVYNVATYNPGDASIASIKEQEDGQTKRYSGNIVSAAFPGFFYIQDKDNYQGIKVISPDSVPVGCMVDVTGTTAGQGSERYINCPAGYVTVTDYGPYEIDPVGLGCSDLGGSSLNAYTPGVKDGKGPNNLGLLVTVWGKVTARIGNFFYIDDGSGVIDPRLNPVTFRPFNGIKVIINTNTPQIGEYWSVTGISTLETASGNLIRAIRPRGLEDLRKVSN